MTVLPRRARLLALVASAVAVLAVALAPASSAATRPAQVGLISFTAGSLSGGKATLTMQWPKAAYARSYEIFLSTSYDAVLSTRVHATTTGTSYRLTGLQPGTDYFVTIRGKNGSTAGPRAKRVGRTTIAGEGTDSGGRYSVMTFNLCSEATGCRAFDTTRRKAVLDRIAYLRPTVLALQESGALTRGRAGINAIPGYTRAAYYSAKALYFRDDVFSLVPIGSRTGLPSEPGDLDGCEASTTHRYGCVVLRSPRDGAINRYAVWAELRDRATGQRSIFTSAHLTVGSAGAQARMREDETWDLIKGVKAVNPETLPMVFAGDFNSHKNRSNDYTGEVFERTGHRDAFDQARSVSRQHNNSYTGWTTTPTISYTWGDHVDHVWVQYRQARVERWANVVPFAGSRYASPMLSDHAPILVGVRLN